jgi:hypothetical protein
MMAMLSKSQVRPVPPPPERIGYTHGEPAIAYATGETSPQKLRNYKAVRIEKRLAWLLMAAGGALAWHESGNHATDAPALIANLSPLEICAAGVLLRLHAAWHRATKVV